MKILNKRLEDAIRKHPEKKYKIIFTTKEGTDLKQLKISDTEELMQNIYSAEISGSQIQTLAENKKVDSIELDQEMSIT